MLKIPKTVCSACGTSTTNHRFLFISNSIEETIGRFGDKIFIHSKQGKRIAEYVEKLLHKILSLVRIIRYDTNVEKASSGRSRLIWEEARLRGIHIEQVVILGRYSDYYRMKINDDDWFYFESLAIPPYLPESDYSWIDNKLILTKKLTEINIPTPKTKEIKTLTKAKVAFNQMNKPLIIKPKKGSRGRHTTTNINTLEELEKAFDLAYQISPSMVIQEHLYGSVYRATVINKKLVGFFRADPPNITGNGKNTIAELIDIKNKNKSAKLSSVSISSELESFIKRQGYDLKSILPEKKTIDLIAKTGRLYGGYTKEMLPEVHPEMHAIFEKIGKLIEAPVLGFDLIIEDPTKNPNEQRWGIIECNSLPFIDLHYFALEGNPINLAKNIWDLWDLK